MNNIFYDLLVKFTQGIGVKDNLVESIKFFPEIFILASFVACFWGFRLFRWWSAFVGFLITGIGVTEILKQAADKDVIITISILVGFAGASLSYQLYKASAFMVCSLMGYNLISYIYTGDVWLYVVAAVILVMLASFCTDYLIIVASSIWGGVTICVNGQTYFPGYDNYIIGIAMLIFIAAGCWVQYKINEGSLIFRRRNRKSKYLNPNRQKGGF